MMHRIRVMLGLLLMIAGIGIFLYPEIQTELSRQAAEDAIQEFTTQYREDVDDFSSTDAVKTETEEPDCEDTPPEVTDTLWTQQLLEEIQAYNEALYVNGQDKFRDAWSVTQSPTIFSSIGQEMFGYIEVPAMDVKLPLYIGATQAHMASGAAILGETSMPIGGSNTNCVIAGHRGFRGSPFFREIENVLIGDYVYVTNPWETLCYRVESIDIIDPTDSDKVKIQEGKDMITLITCHPYRSHGKYRYVVYCIRDEADDFSQEASSKDQIETKPILPNPELMITKQEIHASDGAVYEASEPDIATETWTRYAGAALILLMICITLIRSRNENKEEKPK